VGADLPLHVEERGTPRDDGETFVLVHGYGASSFSWRTWVPALERRGRVLLVDLKGFGRAPRPADGLYAPGTQAELVHRLMVERALAGVTLFGHSLGGGVALLTALRLLDAGDTRLRRLVIVAGAAYRQHLPPFVGLSYRPRLFRALLRILGARTVAAMVLRTCVHDPTTVTNAQIEGYAAPMRRPGTARALIDTARQIVPDDLDTLVVRYPQLRMPTLVLWGRQDPVVPLANARRLAAALPHARLVVLDRCGHLPAEERPADSLRALESFLDDTPAGRPALRQPAAYLRPASPPPRSRPT
jgi:pimeloyl-ACP methyl ester carboxylesterase